MNSFPRQVEWDVMTAYPRATGSWKWVDGDAGERFKLEMHASKEKE